MVVVGGGWLSCPVTEATLSADGKSLAEAVRRGAVADVFQVSLQR